jgi:hypothetical protein
MSARERSLTGGRLVVDEVQQVHHHDRDRLGEI